MPDFVTDDLRPLIPPTVRTARLESWSPNALGIALLLVALELATAAAVWLSW